MRLPCGVCTVNEGRPPVSSATSLARTSASSASPTSTTRAVVSGAIARTAGSSALSTASPSGGSAATSSDLAVAMASREPNSPTCAVPTLSTTPTRGGAIRAR